MRFVAVGGAFGLEEGGDEEGVFVEFERADGVVGAEGGEVESAVGKAILEFWIYAVAALVGFDDLVGVVDFAKARSFLKEERLGLIDERAGKF